MDPRTKALIEAPIAPTLLRLAVPNIITTVVQASTGLIETYYIGKLGTDAPAGVALVFSGVMLMQMMSSGAMGGGVSSAIARALGANRREDADATILHALIIALFDRDPAMIAAGSTYLRIVGPFFGFFGLGMALYFASQGAGALQWPPIAGVSRLVIAVGGGWLALSLTGSLTLVFAALGLGLAVLGLLIAGAVKAGAWLSGGHDKPAGSR